MYFANYKCIFNYNLVQLGPKKNNCRSPAKMCGAQQLTAYEIIKISVASWAIIRNPVQILVVLGYVYWVPVKFFLCCLCHL